MAEAKDLDLRDWLAGQALNGLLSGDNAPKKSGAESTEQYATYLRLAHESADWRSWEVRDAAPPASNGARVTAVDPAGFEVESGGPTVVRQRYTRWWNSDGACVSRAPGDWTRVTPVDGGRVRVRAGFPMSDGPDCKNAVAGG